jgi:tetratricopeptide (TPR) repeat protein
MNAYNSGDYLKAIQYYKSALDTKGGDQLRAYNGVYLSNWKLRERKRATEAFGKVIDYSLDHKKLAVLFLFKPASIDLWTNNKNKSPYSMWLGQIATHAADRGTCMEVTGHTTKTGFAGLNDRLSVMRAEYIAHQIAQISSPMAKRILANGVGSRENLIGTGADNASDALDRRVEFKVIPCS